MNYSKKFTILFFLIANACFGQSIKLQGKIIDAVNQLPIADVFIYSSTSNSTISDGVGSFNLTVSLKDTIRFSHLGYLDAFTIVNSNKELVIKLLPNKLTLENVVIKGFENELSPQQISASVGVLGLAELKRDNNISIVPAINRTPGVLMQSGSYNTNRLTIRGIGAREPYGSSKIRAYLNNIPLTTGDGSTTIEDIDLDLIQRVEVLKGPTSSIYGAGLGGTVLYDGGTPVHANSGVRTELITGSFGLLKSNTDIQLVKEGVSLGLSYNNMQSDGYRDNNNYNRESFLAVGSINRKSTQISFIANFIDLFGQIPSSIDSATFANSPSSAAANWSNTEGFEEYKKGLIGLTVGHNFTENTNAQLSVFQNSKNSYERRPFNILTENSRSYGSRGTFFYNNSNSWLRDLGGGFEYFFEICDWQTYENDNKSIGNQLSDNYETRNFWNIFLQSSFQPSAKLRIDAGINLNKTQYKLEDRFAADSINLSGTYGFNTIISPRLAINYSMSTTMNLFALVAHGFSPPSFSETLTPTGQINPDIQPEMGMNYEIGFKGELIKRWYLDASVYSMNIRDLIVAKRIAEDQFVGVNAGRTMHNGLEAYTKYQGSFKHFNILPYINYTLSLYRFNDFQTENEDYSGNDLTGVPRHQVDVGIDFNLRNGLYANLNYHFVGSMPMRDDNTKYSTAYGITNGKLGWTRTFGNFNFDLYGGIQNIFNVNYASMILVNAPSFGGNDPRYYYPGLPVNFYGGISLRYALDNR
jgi:iron complex outermembrane receptor protein